MKHLSFFLLLIVAIPLYGQGTKPYSFNWKSTKMFFRQSKQFAKEHEYVTFDMNEIHSLNGIIQSEVSYEVIICYKKKHPFVYVGQTRTSHFIIDGERMMFVSHNDKTISSYKKKKGKDNTNWYLEMGIHGYLYTYLYELWYYLSPLHPTIKTTGNGFLITNAKDTVMDNVPFRIYEGHSGRRYAYNAETERTDIPIDNMITCFVNTNTLIMDSMVSVCVGKKEKESYYRTISNISFDNCQHKIDSIFNFSDKTYSDYTLHNELSPLEIVSQNHVSDNNVLEYPICDLYGNKTCIAQNTGWVLINFWTFNCPSCIEHLKEYGHEQDSLGYRVLENEGIKIYAINYTSDNMELIQKVADKTGTADIMYSAKGMNTLINIPALGYYYLLSPDKEIVYETYDMGDYSELLKAKAEYEKTHANK